MITIEPKRYVIPRASKGGIMGVSSIHKLPTIEELRKSGSENHIPTYNYCGSGTQYFLRQSGDYEEMMDEAGKPLKGTKPYGKPIDRVDNACMKHDKVYATEYDDVSEIRKADQELKDDVEKILKSGGGGLKEKGSAFLVGKAMGLKMKAEDVGLLKKGSFSSVKKACNGGVCLCGH